MLCKDAGGRVPLVGSWKSGLSMVLGLIGIVAIGLPEVEQGGSYTAHAQTSRSLATGAENVGSATTVPAAKQLKVMAIVNGKQITRQQLADECIRRYGATVL